MLSSLQYSTGARNTSHLNLVPKPSKADLSTRHLVHFPDPSILTVRNSLTEISNILHRLPATARVNDTSVADSSSHQSHSHPTIHVGRVATVDRHDTDAWTQERKVHDSKFNAAATSSSLGSNGTVPNDCPPVDMARRSSAIMELRTQGPRHAKQFSTAARCEDATLQSCDWTLLGTPSLGASAVRPNATIGSWPRENLSEGRRRVGEILTRCGVINGSGMSSIESTAIGCCDSSHSRPIDATAISDAIAGTFFGDDDGVLITALADWTSEWVYTFVIQPYLRGNFRFQYRGKPSGASASVATRIRRVLSAMYNPVQVAIHALWFISTLTGNGAHDNASFLSVPIFRYLHNNGTFAAEDFMFRTFVTCAMIGDKTINDATLSTNAWNRLTGIPQVILNATEKYALRCLKWNVVMTQTQWQDIITYLRSCIKMGSIFDPFAYDKASPSGIMARYLDELIHLSYANETASPEAKLLVEILAPQPIRHFTHWEVFNATEWCPEDDPVINRKPRTISIAPGTNHNLSAPHIGTTAKDLLDSILGSSNLPDLPDLPQLQTSFCGSFGTIGARLSHTIKISGWFPFNTTLGAGFFSGLPVALMVK